MKLQPNLSLKKQIELGSLIIKKQMEPISFYLDLIPTSFLIKKKKIKLISF